MTDLAVIPHVPIARTGTHATSVGNGTFTHADLEAMVAAQNDPAVKTARTLLGHSVIPSPNGGAELIPRAVVGRTDNLQVDGDTLYADIHVPQWMADVADIATPSRSIEALRDVRTDTGTYSMVLTGLALLSDELPAVETLEDLQDLWARTNTAAAPEPAVDAAPVAASRLVVCSTPNVPAPVAAEHTNAQEGPMADPQPNTPDTPEVPASEAAETPAVTTTTDPAPGAETEQPQAAPVQAEAAPDTPASPVVPDGFELIDQATLAELREGNRLARELAEQRRVEERDSYLEAAVAAGRIAPAARAQVTALFDAAPEQARAYIDAQPTQSIPVGAVVTASRQVHDQPDTSLDLSLCTPAQIAALKARGIVTDTENR